MSKRYSRFGTFNIVLYLDEYNPCRQVLATASNYIYGLDVFWAVVHRYDKDSRHIWFELLEQPECSCWEDRRCSCVDKLYEIACNRGDQCPSHGKFRDKNLRTWQDCPTEKIYQLTGHDLYKVSNDE